MVSKKKRFGEDEIAIFDDGCIYKRGDYWHFRLWLRAENKYARKSLGTTNRATAIACRRSGRTSGSYNLKRGFHRNDYMSDMSNYSYDFRLAYNSLP